MSDQEIIDAIDAEIARARATRDEIRSYGPEDGRYLCQHIAFLNGLRFGKELIVKRMEGGK